MILWISTRISNVGETSLYTQSLQWAYTASKEGTYEIWMVSKSGYHFSVILSPDFPQTTPGDTPNLGHPVK